MSDQIDRREFLASSVATAAVVSVAGIGAVVAKASDATDANNGNSDESPPKLLEEHPHAKDGGMDIVLRFSGRMDADAATLAKFSKWTTANQNKYGGLEILEHGPRKLVVRFKPIGAKPGAEDCLPCHMVLCTCSCFQEGGPGGNCANCSHSAADHY